MRAAKYSAGHERIVKKERAREFIFSSPFCFTLLWRHLRYAYLP